MKEILESLVDSYKMDKLIIEIDNDSDRQKLKSFFLETFDIVLPYAVVGNVYIFWKSDLITKPGFVDLRYGFNPFTNYVKHKIIHENYTLISSTMFLENTLSTPLLTVIEDLKNLLEDVSS